uniref:DUF4976 domain-containing protein n=1 Tax=Gongylonema pulchrum TaxID=637853 RepID=A0A183EXP4_9BILA
LWSMDLPFKKLENGHESQDKSMSLKEIQEQLRRDYPDINDYYHAGVWDLEKDSTSALKPVAIFEDRRCADPKQRVCYNGH